MALSVPPADLVKAKHIIDSAIGKLLHANPTDRLLILALTRKSRAAIRSVYLIGDALLLRGREVNPFAGSKPPRACKCRNTYCGTTTASEIAIFHLFIGINGEVMLAKSVDAFQLRIALLAN